MCGQLTEELVFIIKQKVIKNPVTDLFQQLKSIKKKPICLFPTRKQCHHFLITMLGHLTSEIHEIPCIDQVDETMSTITWTKQAVKRLEKLKSDCSLTAGLEATLSIKCWRDIVLIALKLL